MIARTMKVRAIAVLLLLAPSLVSAQTSPTIEFVRFTPAAIFGDGVDSTTVQVRVNGAVNKAQIVLSPIAAATPVTTYELFDDGTNGDERPADQIFSRSGLKLVGSQNTLIFGTVQ